MMVAQVGDVSEVLKQPSHERLLANLTHASQYNAAVPVDSTLGTARDIKGDAISEDVIEVGVAMKDPDGDQGLWFGAVDKDGKPHGDGELRYDNSTLGMFRGSARNGALWEGTAYNGAQGVPNEVMRNGKWVH